MVDLRLAAAFLQKGVLLTPTSSPALLLLPHDDLPASRQVHRASVLLIPFLEKVRDPAAGLLSTELLVLEQAHQDITANDACIYHAYVTSFYSYPGAWILSSLSSFFCFSVIHIFNISLRQGWRDGSV